MPKLYFIFFFSIINIGISFAQQTKTDTTTNLLPTVTITAFEQNRTPLEVNAPVAYINKKALYRFDNTSLVPVFSNVSGVRMEERSPGSYRLNIRGSTLRSPFGVRNVKVYINDIPFTDPGGTTYLNQLALQNVQQAEIIKGPAGSLYGAGNGGVVLLNTNTPQPSSVSANVALGSFGLQQYNVTAIVNNGTGQHQLAFTKLKSEGYRNHTEMKRTIVNWMTSHNLSTKSKLNTILLYGDLFYNTPGGLTEAEYIADAKQARPKVGTLPSAATAKAAINQQTFYIGISHSYTFSPIIKNTTSVYGAFSRVQNQSIRNYERRTEPHIGTRSIFIITPKIKTGSLKIVTGIEAQNGWYSTKVYKNKNGNSDSLQTDDELKPRLAAAFIQADYSIGKLIATAGVSTNSAYINIQRLSTVPSTAQSRQYKNEIAPRISLLYKLLPNWSIYASSAKGFSPPTVAEVLPSTGVISTTLNAENGINYELGTKWQHKKGIYLEAAAYQLKLQNAITIRKDISGADYFVNSGNTTQKGLELDIRYQPHHNKATNISTYFINATLTKYTYTTYKQNTTDLGGKYIPGTPKYTINTGVDVKVIHHFFATTTLQYVSSIPLNDLNTFSTSEYYLLNGKISYKNTFLKKLSVDLFAAANNIFAEKYSLGNDINATGNRFYNVAPGRNYTVGLLLNIQY